jgi:hypothetical protein
MRSRPLSRRRERFLRKVYIAKMRRAAAAAQKKQLERERRRKRKRACAPMNYDGLAGSVPAL